MLKTTVSLALCALMLLGCDDPSASGICSEDEFGEQHEDPAQDPTGAPDPEPDAPESSTTPPDRAPEACELPLDPDADAFATVMRTEFAEEGDVRAIELFDADDELVASLVTTFDPTDLSIHMIGEFAYADSTAEFLVAPVADPNGTMKHELTHIEASPENQRRVDLLMAKAYEQGLLLPGGEDVPAGAIACAGSVLVMGGTCAACAACAGVSEGLCLWACAAACAGSAAGALCSCKDDAEHNC